MHVRLAASGDAGSISELLTELGYPAEAVSVTARIESLVLRTHCQLLVAEDSGRVIGVGSCHVFPVLHSDDPVALITALVVSASDREKGVGRALLNHIEDFARTQGCRRIVVTTALHREDAHAFYEHVGYEFTGRRYVKEPL